MGQAIRRERLQRMRAEIVEGDGGGDPRSRLASSIAMTALYDDTMPPAAVAALP